MQKNIVAINEKNQSFVTMCVDNPSIDFRQKVNLARNIDTRVCTDTDDSLLLLHGYEWILARRHSYPGTSFCIFR